MWELKILPPTPYLQKIFYQNIIKYLPIPALVGKVCRHLELVLFELIRI